jgi:hypothetical protein
VYDIVNMYHNFFPDAFFIVNYNAITIVVPGKTRYIQLILKEKKPWEVIDSFDLDYVQAYYDGREIRAFPECINAWAVKRATPVRENIYPGRIAKAIEKGFEILVETKLPEKKSRWNFYYPRKDEEREHVRHILKCLYPHAQGVFDEPGKVKEFLVNRSGGDNYQTVEVGADMLLNKEMGNLDTSVRDLYITRTESCDKSKRLDIDTPIVINIKGVNVPYGIETEGPGGRTTRGSFVGEVECHKTVEMLHGLDKKFLDLIKKNAKDMKLENKEWYRCYCPLTKLKGGRDFEEDLSDPYEYWLRFKVQDRGKYETKFIDGVTGESISYDEMLRGKKGYTADIEAVVSHCWTANGRCGAMAQVRRMVIWPGKIFTEKGALCGVLRAWRAE